MDEAERCHEIAYLAYGHLLAAGRGEDVIARSGLHMWQVSGAPHDLSALAEMLRGSAGVAMATPFGARLRVEIGRANVLTPVTNAHLVCRLLIEKKNLHSNNYVHD